ncbi:hypothetical protein DB30_05917 [Enhygromyxa salina]|uniref:Uncharacterized protein n=1 Tax=Enhygromyxa salina TaxID=215803 RepID=A0A0C2A6K6_9BACT|nr:hypothetical protein DB30_05917 [Enhygromyxa salina]
MRVAPRSEASSDEHGQGEAREGQAAVLHRADTRAKPSPPKTAVIPRPTPTNPTTTLAIAATSATRLLAACVATRVHQTRPFQPGVSTHVEMSEAKQGRAKIERPSKAPSIFCFAPASSLPIDSGLASPPRREHQRRRHGQHRTEPCQHAGRGRQRGPGGDGLDPPGGCLGEPSRPVRSRRGPRLVWVSGGAIARGSWRAAASCLSGAGIPGEHDNLRECDAGPSCVLD